jgi:hypothetical protein
LFSSKTKFDSGNGWPIFWQPLSKANIVEKPDNSYGISGLPFRANAAPRTWISTHARTPIMRLPNISNLPSPISNLEHPYASSLSVLRLIALELIRSFDAIDSAPNAYGCSKLAIGGR